MLCAPFSHRTCLMKYKHIRMIFKSTRILLLLVLLTAVQSAVNLTDPSPTCPLLCASNCSTTSSCTSCYDTFELNSQTRSGSNCACPTSMYIGTDYYCYPCPIECLSCSNATICSSCINGYMISNGHDCIPNTTNLNNWVTKNVTREMEGVSEVGMSSLVLIINGSQVNVTDDNVANYTSKCDPVAPPMLGPFSYNTKYIKNIVGLPPHQWINIRFHAVLIDRWEANTLNLELNYYKNYWPNSLSLPQAIWSGTFSSSQRNHDFCGNPSIADNLVTVDAWAAHNHSLVKMQIRMN